MKIDMSMKNKKIQKKENVNLNLDEIYESE